MLRLFLVCAVALSVCLSAMAQTPSVQQQSPVVHPSWSLATMSGVVSNVVDGDTLRVMVEGTETTVRLLGIDAPESVHPTKPVEFWGPESSAAMKQLVEGQTVMLEPHEDPNEQTDKYGRLLCYVYLASETKLCVNSAMVLEGHARSYREYPCKYTAHFNLIESGARAEGRGMWSFGKIVEAAKRKAMTPNDWFLLRQDCLRVMREIRNDASGVVARGAPFLPTETEEIKPLTDAAADLFDAVRVMHTQKLEVPKKALDYCVALRDLRFSDLTAPSDKEIETLAEAWPPQSKDDLRVIERCYLHLRMLLVSVGFQEKHPNFAEEIKELKFWASRNPKDGSEEKPKQK